MAFIFSSIIGFIAAIVSKFALDYSTLSAFGIYMGLSVLLAMMMIAKRASGPHGPAAASATMRAPAPAFTRAA
ncbi:hypothetical protein [Pseudoprimorskyibacter insulae]|nr:hypothetical protein [Pseudoprimorskyibacter insulae]